MNEIIHKIKGYLGCEVPLWCSENILYHDKVINLDELMDNLRISNVCKAINKGDIKLKLRKLDSLTKKEAQYINDELDLGAYSELEVIDYIKQNYDVLSIAIIEYLNSIHIDYQDLIGQGLAVDINESNVQNMHKGA